MGISLGEDLVQLLSGETEAQLGEARTMQADRTDLWPPPSVFSSTSYKVAGQKRKLRLNQVESLSSDW